MVDLFDGFVKIVVPKCFESLYKGRLDQFGYKKKSKNAKAKTVAEAVYDNWIVSYGPPEGIISDGGKEFTAKELWKEIYEIFNELKEVYQVQEV